MGEPDVWGAGSAEGANSSRGFLRDVAEGVARAVKSWPALSACLLLACTLALPSNIPSVALAHVAGMALLCVPGHRRLMILTGWFAFAVAQWLLGSEATGPRSDLDWDLPLRATACLLALAWAAPRLEVWFAAVVAAAGTVIACGMEGRNRQALMFAAYLPPAVIPFLFIALGRRRWFTASVVTAVVGLGVILVLQPLSFGRAGSAMGIVWSLFVLVISVPILLSAAVAGAAVRAAEDGAPRDHGALLVATLQRRPWMTGFALGTTLLLGVSAFQLAPSQVGSEPLDRLVRLAVTAGSVSLIASIASAGGSLFGALTTAVPVCIASLALLGVALDIQTGGLVPYVPGLRRLLVAAVPPAALGVTWCALQVPGRRFPALLPFLVIFAALLPQFLPLGGDDAWNGVALWTLVLVPSAIMAVAARETSAERLLVTAVLIGLAS